MRCESCPVADGYGCPSVSHPHYCNFIQKPGAKGEYWREFLRTGARAEIVVRADDDRRVKACLVTPSLNIGGADRWMIALMESTADRIRWVGIACLSDDFVVPSIRAECERFAPTAIGVENVRPLMESADVAVCWGVPLDRAVHLAGPERKAKIL